MSLPNHANCALASLKRIKKFLLRVFKIYISNARHLNLTLCLFFFRIFKLNTISIDYIMFYLQYIFCVVVSFRFTQKRKNLNETEKKHCKIRHWRSTLVLFCHVEISINWLCVQFTTENPDPAQYTQRKREKKNEEKKINSSKFQLQFRAAHLRLLVYLFRQMFTLVSRWFDLQSIFKSMFWFNALSLCVCVLNSLSLFISLSFIHSLSKLNAISQLKTEHFFFPTIIVYFLFLFFLLFPRFHSNVKNLHRWFIDLRCENEMNSRMK